MMSLSSAFTSGIVPLLQTITRKLMACVMLFAQMEPMLWKPTKFAKFVILAAQHVQLAQTAKLAMAIERWILLLPSALAWITITNITPSAELAIILAKLASILASISIVIVAIP